MSASSGKGRSRCWSMTLLCVVNLSLALHMKTFIIYLMHTRKFAALNSELKPSNIYISFSSFMALEITYSYFLHCVRARLRAQGHKYAGEYGSCRERRSGERERELMKIQIIYPSSHSETNL